MRRIHLATSLALLAVSASSGVAQVFERPEPPQPVPNIGGVNERNDVPICGTTAGASRVRRNNCELETPEEAEREAIVRTPPIELPRFLAPQCEATATTEYVQQGTVARIDSTVSLAQCPAGSAGEFTFVITVRDDGGATKPLEFKETWQRSDDRDARFAADYPIGEGVTLVGVRMRDLICTCVEPPSGEPGE